MSLKRVSRRAKELSFWMELVMMMMTMMVFEIVTIMVVTVVEGGSHFVEISLGSFGATLALGLTF